MMILLIDVGNTRIKWALLDHGNYRYGGSANHRGLPFKDLAESLWGGLSPPSRILVANVAGKGMERNINGWAKGKWGIKPEFIVPQKAAYGVVNAYIEPAQLGADRWAALIAAHHESRGAACIVDCGTAITIDALSSEGEHLGGIIAPGLTMMRQALVKGTHRLKEVPEAPMGKRVALLARDTSDAIAGGTLYAAVALIDRVVSDVEEAVGTSLTCFITGGDASHVMPLLAADFRYEEDLVLRGLAIIAQAT